MLKAKRDNLYNCKQHIKNADCVLTTKPLEIQVEVTKECNIACIMCIGNYGASIRQGSITPNLEKNISEILPFAIVGYLFGGGEPFMYRNITGLIELFGKHQVVTDIHTNGTLLNDDITNKLVTAGVHILTFSIDGATKNTYEKLRVNSNFDTVVSNINAISEIKREKGCFFPLIHLAMVAMKENIQEVPQLILLAKACGAQAVHVQKLASSNVSGYDSMFNAQNIDSLDMKFLSNIVDSALRIAEESHIQFTTYLSTSGHYPKNKRSMLPLHFKQSIKNIFTDFIRRIKSHRVNFDVHCTKPWTTMYIEWNGNVKPCCFSMTQLGNILESTYDEVWNGSKYIKFRRSMLDRTPPLDCQRCIVNNESKNDFTYLEQMLATAGQIFTPSK